MNSKKKQQDPSIALGAGIYGAEVAKLNANATDAMIEGMDLFREAAQKLGAVNPKIAQGNLFEYIEAAKKDADAAVGDSTLKAVVTAASGNPHAAADLLIQDGDRLVREVQAKSMNRVSNLTTSLSEAKYEGMQKLVPEGNAAPVRELAQKRSQYPDDSYADTAQNVTERLKHGGIESEGTSYQENLRAAKNPRLYAAVTEGKYIAQEAIATGANAAIAGFIISSAISGVKNTIAVSQGEISIDEAIVNTIQDGAKSAIRSGVTAAGGTAIRYGATKAGIKALNKSNVAIAVAASVIDIGASVYSFTKGEITEEELIEKIGYTGTCTAYSLYAGAAAGAVLGSFGAVVGSLAGYLIAASIYQSTTAIFQEARLAEAEAERIIAMSDVACTMMQQQREEFKRLFQINFESRCAEFDACFADIDRAFTTDNHCLMTQSLGNFAALFGKKLQFANFEEFDNFMLDPDLSLTL